MANDLVVSLFRHGLTLDNERKAYIGWTDAPLSEKGKSRLPAALVDDVRPEIIFSSPLQRCVETASILFPKHRIERIADLKEMNFGAWEGKTYAELKHLPSYRNWLTDIFTQAIEAGETYAQFSERIEKGLQKIWLQTNQVQANRIAVVTHGGVIRYVLHTLFPHEKSFFEWDIPFGGGYELTWEKDALDRSEGRCTLLAVGPTTVKQIG